MIPCDHFQILEKLDPIQDAKVLARIILNNNDERVELAAIRRINLVRHPLLAEKLKKHLNRFATNRSALHRKINRALAQAK